MDEEHGPLITIVGHAINEVLCADEKTLMYLFKIFSKFDNEKLNCEAVDEEMDEQIVEAIDEEEFEPWGSCDNVDAYGMLC